MIQKSVGNIPTVNGLELSVPQVDLMVSMYKNIRITFMLFKFDIGDMVIDKACRWEIEDNYVKLYFQYSHGICDTVMIEVKDPDMLKTIGCGLSKGSILPCIVDEDGNTIPVPTLEYLIDN